MRVRLLMCVALAAGFLCTGAAFAQDPFNGGITIPLDYGKLIATMGEQNDSLRGAILNWDSIQTEIIQLSNEAFSDGYQCGEDRDFVAADFNSDGMDEIVYAWNRNDGGIFVGIPTYDLINMNPVAWNTPDPPISAGLLYATDTLAQVIGEIRVAAGNFYGDEGLEFVLAYLAADSTVSITVFDVDTLSLTPEAKGSISDQAIHTEMPEVQRFGAASRFDIATGDMDNDGTDEIILIASDPAQSPETDLIVNIYDYNAAGHTIDPVSQNSHVANMKASEVSCLRRVAATTGDFDADNQDEIAFIDDWARTDVDTLHYSCMHVLDFSSDMLSIVDSWDWDSTGFAHLNPKQSTNENIYALTEYEGDLIAGGRFTSEQGGSTPLNYIARWDGTAWRPIGSGLDHYVMALAVYNGNLFAGGYFTHAGGHTTFGIARWDGSDWHVMNSEGLGSNVVNALTVYDGNLIAGGEFTSMNSVPNTKYIARWDGSQWHALGSGMNGIVTALAVYQDTLLFAGGHFTNAGGNTTYGIARWDGSDWYVMNLEGLSSNKVFALTEYNGDLIAGGEFTSMNYVPNTRYIARWDGSAWNSLGSGFNGSVYSLTTFNLGSHGEVLVAGGGFTDVNLPDAFYRLAWWDDDDPHWSPFQEDSSGASSTVRALTEYDGDLIVAGIFGHLYAPYPTNSILAVHIGRVKPEGDGVIDTLRARSDFIIDIVSDDVDFAPNSADEIIVRGYHDPAPSLGDARTAFWIMGIDSATFTGCYRAGGYAGDGIWGSDGINGSRRTLAVGDFVDDADNFKDLLILVTDTVNAIRPLLQAWEIDTAILIPCGDPGQSNLPFVAGWTDDSQTITELITADLDTATIELVYSDHWTVDSIVQPLVILQAPPVHYDILDDTTWDVSNRYPWPPDASYDTYCAYGMISGQSIGVTSQIKKDWGISAGLQANFSSCGATVKAHLNTEYGEGFSVQGGNTQTINVTEVMTEHHYDRLLVATISYDVWEYNVYRRGELLVGGDVVVVDPASVEQGWIDGRESEFWIPDHEVDNIFSYPDYDDLTDNPMVTTESVFARASAVLMSESSELGWAVTKYKVDSSGYASSSNFGVAVGASLGYEGGLRFFGLGAKWGFEVSVEGTYDQSELNTYSTTLTAADSIYVWFANINSSGSTNGNRKYHVTPYTYWARNGALVLDYTTYTDPSPNGEDPTWWENHYNDPDPAFILPWRLDPEKDGETVPGEGRYKTKEIVFIPKNPSPGDTVLIIARVHNFSLNPTEDPVQVSFYLGDPDNFGQLLYDKNTGDSLSYGCDADGFPAAIASQGEVAAQMVWQVPSEGDITSCQRIWALIDPLDSITPEVHDNNDAITNNKGWARLDVITTTECIDRDGDGWEESAFRCCDAYSHWDNCPDVYNPDQLDTDGDGIGNACQVICGDASGDETINVGDAVYLINYIFKGGPAPNPLCEGDASGDDTINVGDAVYLINYIFKGGSAPVEPCCP